MTVALTALLLAATLPTQPPAIVQGPSPVPFELAVKAQSVEVRVANGVGQVKDVQPAGEGKFKARFVSPPVRFPQVALLAVDAKDATGAVTRHWASLVLKASANLKIETKPNTTVTVTIEGETFGPKKADKKGRVTIAARVPPGVPTATVTAVDRAGNKTTQPLDLAQQDFTRVVGAPLAGPATPDAAATVQLFAVDQKGAPLEDAAGLRLKAQHGTFDPPRPKGGGVFEADYHAPTKLTGERDELTLGLGTVPPTVLVVPLQPGAPARVEIAFPSSAWVAGGAPVEVKAVVTDQHGNQTPGGPGVQLESDIGSVDGTTLTLPNAFGGRTTVTVRATAGGVTGEQVLELKPAAPASATLTIPDAVAAGDELNGTLDVRDPYGNLVGPDAVSVVSGTGRAATVTAGDERGHHVTYTPARDAPAGTLGLEVRAGGKALSTTQVAVLPYERPWAVVLGGQVTGAGNLPLTSLSPRLSLGLRLGKTPLEVAAEGAYGWSPHVEGAPTTDGFVDGRLDLTTLSAALSLRYRWVLNPTWSAALSATGGMLWATSHVSAAGVVGTRDGHARVPLLRGGGGVSMNLGTGRLVGLLEYTWAPGSEDQLFVKGNLGGVGVSLGYFISL